eukprot:gnl/MRDRNA2_/MRDRNA2_65393_c0_seq2.p1 gnl/MRDRNA2_/MRDRNA2_65393_c0~~gnl/MRDRNA2_/MRDRNA2_65393_c0_seq2.p1  ORF type:complete len:216 (-),score=28.61 gnl/MRDRNA2_/MRDRNA2_65393_c0_seq2:237-884(-)
MRVCQLAFIFHCWRIACGAPIPSTEHHVQLSVDARGSVRREDRKQREPDPSKKESPSSVDLNAAKVASPVRLAAVTEPVASPKELSERENPLTRVIRRIQRPFNRAQRKKRLRDSRQPSSAGKAPIAGAPITDVPVEDKQGRFNWAMVLGAIAVVIFLVVFARVNLVTSSDLKEAEDPQALLGGSSTFLAACTLGIVNNNSFNTIMGASQQLAAL